MNSPFHRGVVHNNIVQARATICFQSALVLVSSRSHQPRPSRCSSRQEQKSLKSLILVGWSKKSVGLSPHIWQLATAQTLQLFPRFHAPFISIPTKTLHELYTHMTGHQQSFVVFESRSQRVCLKRAKEKASNLWNRGQKWWCGLWNQTDHSWKIVQMTSISHLSGHFSGLLCSLSNEKSLLAPRLLLEALRADTPQTHSLGSAEHKFGLWVGKHQENQHHI